MADPAVTLRDVSKRYGPVSAVDGVTLEVGRGEVYALLGLNGAGKTTLMRILLGMVRPGGGSVTILGRDVRDRAVRAEIGYLVETASAYPELTVRENLEVARRLRRVPRRAAVEDAVELFGLREHADRRARALSLGNLQRLALARATLHRPALLVLDEPVNGLDPAGVVEVRLLLGRLAREHGTTVLLSSHILGEVARVATRIGILHRGRLLDEFGASGLAERVERRLEVTTRDDAAAASVLRSAGLAVHERRGSLVLADAAVVDRPEEVAVRLVHAGVPPTGMTVVHEDLEAWFLRRVGAGPTATPGSGAAAPGAIGPGAPSAGAPSAGVPSADEEGTRRGR
ncbi:ABC transporter ATP-binding protein [Kocuria sp. M1R5S2]|uniref:ABC transporter ATP-binding protein n=1 Tax=Kocuria rhizosphaerae TaxID=3376285 RepID=UPI00378BD416